MFKCKKPRLKEAANTLVCLGKEMMQVLKCKDWVSVMGVNRRQVVVRAAEVNDLLDEMEMVQARELESENLVCTSNQKHADFSTEVAKMLMRRI